MSRAMYLPMPRTTFARTSRYVFVRSIYASPVPGKLNAINLPDSSDVIRLQRCHRLVFFPSTLVGGTASVVRRTGLVRSSPPRTIGGIRTPFCAVRRTHPFDASLLFFFWRRHLFVDEAPRWLFVVVLYAFREATVGEHTLYQISPAAVDRRFTTFLRFGHRSLMHDSPRQRHRV